ncbi:MAG: DUF3857 domain-containing protein [Saprospiraceae bacterium]
MIKNIFLLLLASSLYGVSLAQKYKFGDVTPELLQLQTCPIDSNANAMITFESGILHSDFHDTRGMKTTFTHRTQIKLFDNRAKVRGTVVFFYISPERNSIRLNSIKGHTYNLENGKIKKTELSDENVFEERFNRYLKKVSIAIPNVVDGCVFEYEYTLSYPYLTFIPDWNIQYDIPVLYNEMETELPENFVFQVNMLGSISPVLDEQEFHERMVSYYQQKKICTASIGYNKRKFKFENIPAFKPEPYTANTNDGKAIIKVHLINIINKFGYHNINFASNYKELNQELLDDEDFGRVCEKGSYIKKIFEPDHKLSIVEKAKAIHSFFESQVKIDENLKRHSVKSGNKLFKDGSGSTFDINLNYIAALNEYGIKTVPVILSTRGNGTPHPTYPDKNIFNYVVALSYIDDQEYFSDPSSSLPFGYLPEKCLNHNGWVVSKSNARWMSLKQNRVGKQIVLNNVEINDNVLNYISTVKKEEYLAFSDMEELRTNDKDDFLNEMSSENELITDSIAVAEENTTNIKYQISYSKVVEDKDYLLIQPFTLLPFDGEQPFVAEKRSSMIDFPYKREYKYIFNVKVPEGMKYQAPENMHIVTEHQDLIFKYQTSFNSNNSALTVVSEFKILKNEFLPDEYGVLKDFIQKALNELSKPIIIKKI